MLQGTYTTAEAARIAQFSVRQLDYWVHQEIIQPSAQKSEGPGTRRLFTFRDLVHLAFIRHLKHHRWSTQKIRLAVTTLRAVMRDPNPLTNAMLVDGKGTVLAVCKTKQGEQILLDTLSGGRQQVMAIVLETLEEETRQIVAVFGDIGSLTDETHLENLRQEPVRR